MVLAYLYLAESNRQSGGQSKLGNFCSLYLQASGASVAAAASAAADTLTRLTKYSLAVNSAAADECEPLMRSVICKDDASAGCLTGSSRFPGPPFGRLIMQHPPSFGQERARL